MRKIRQKNPTLDRLVRTAGSLKKQRDSAEEEFKSHKSIVLDVFSDDEIERHRVYFEGEQDVVVARKIRDNGINAEKLKTAIGAQAFNKLTSPKLDQAKVEAAIAKEELDPNVVAQCLNEQTEYIDVRFLKAKKGKK